MMGEGTLHIHNNVCYVYMQLLLCQSIYTCKKINTLFSVGVYKYMSSQILQTVMVVNLYKCL